MPLNPIKQMLVTSNIGELLLRLLGDLTILVIVVVLRHHSSVGLLVATLSW